MTLWAVKQAEHGPSWPLRLLALEVYDRLNSEHVPCSMITGEETGGSRSGLSGCTVEMLNDLRILWPAVVDECQMAADPCRAITGLVLCWGCVRRKIHLCMAPEPERISWCR